MSACSPRNSRSGPRASLSGDMSQSLATDAPKSLPRHQSPDAMLEKRPFTSDSALQQLQLNLYQSGSSSMSPLSELAGPIATCHENDDQSATFSPSSSTVAVHLLFLPAIAAILISRSSECWWEWSTSIYPPSHRLTYRKCMSIADAQATIQHSVAVSSSISALLFDSTVLTACPRSAIQDPRPAVGISSGEHLS